MILNFNINDPNQSWTLLIFQVGFLHYCPDRFSGTFSHWSVGGIESFKMLLGMRLLPCEDLMA